MSTELTDKKIGIVGFTGTKDEAPWDDPTWEKWGCNNLHIQVDVSKCTRWYDLHDLDTIKGDEQHDQWLRSAPLPVYVMDPQPEWPNAIAYPRDAIVERFGRYFTNSISWMVAHAIMEFPCEIGIWGVDMAQGSEYSAQRPSCEYFIGIAVGLGIKVHIPETSDLLKAAGLYGVEDPGGHLRKKLEARSKELKQRLQETRSVYDQHAAALHQLQGALESNDYILNVWTQPEAHRDGVSTSAKVEEKA